MKKVQQLPNLAFTNTSNLSTNYWKSKTISNSKTIPELGPWKIKEQALLESTKPYQKWVAKHCKPEFQNIKPSKTCTEVQRKM